MNQINLHIIIAKNYGQFTCVRNWLCYNHHDIRMKGRFKFIQAQNGNDFYALKGLQNAFIWLAQDYNRNLSDESRERLGIFLWEVEKRCTIKEAEY